ncbi:hypothetical protein MKEN_00749700 [Mycena kentingensis (nom. inval.)]|nr:hypothetical protein MKEN_00749700 [Mycena kentingensis (nom. inval.)]
MHYQFPPIRTATRRSVQLQPSEIRRAYISAALMVDTSETAFLVGLGGCFLDGMCSNSARPGGRDEQSTERLASLGGLYIYSNVHATNWETMFILQFFLPSLALLTKASNALAPRTNLNSSTLTPITNVWPFGVQSAGIVQTTTGDTRIYYQNADGDIQAVGINGPFITGKVFLDVVLVPTHEVASNSPIAAVGSSGFQIQQHGEAYRV